MMVAQYKYTEHVYNNFIIMLMSFVISTYKYKNSSYIVNTKDKKINHTLIIKIG